MSINKPEIAYNKIFMSSEVNPKSGSRNCVVDSVF